MNTLNVAKSNIIMDGVHCKAQINNEIRRFLLKLPKYDNLISHVQSRFGILINQIFEIKYLDDEGDLITISNDEDLEIAIQLRKGGESLKLVVEVVGDKAKDHSDVVVKVVSEEESNLGKKVQNDEFLGGNGRKFAYRGKHCGRGKGNGKGRGRGRRETLESKCESNEPPMISEEKFEEFSPLDGVQRDALGMLKEKVNEQKSKVVSIKLALRDLRNDETTPKEKIKEVKNNLRNEKGELLILNVQLKELRLKMRETRAALKNQKIEMRNEKFAMKNEKMEMRKDMIAFRRMNRKERIGNKRMRKQFRETQAYQPCPRRQMRQSNIIINTDVNTTLSI